MNPRGVHNLFSLPLPVKRIWILTVGTLMHRTRFFSCLPKPSHDGPVSP